MEFRPISILMNRGWAIVPSQSLVLSGKTKTSTTTTTKKNSHPISFSLAIFLVMKIIGFASLSEYCIGIKLFPDNIFLLSYLNVFNLKFFYCRIKYSC